MPGSRVWVQSFRVVVGVRVLKGFRAQSRVVGFRDLHKRSSLEGVLGVCDFPKLNVSDHQGGLKSSDVASLLFVEACLQERVTLGSGSVGTSSNQKIGSVTW